MLKVLSSIPVAQTPHTERSLPCSWCLNQKELAAPWLQERGLVLPEQLGRSTSLFQWVEGSCFPLSHPSFLLPAGVEFNIDLPNKKVCIESEHSTDTLLATLNKTGKAVSYLGPK